MSQRLLKHIRRREKQTIFVAIGALRVNPYKASVLYVGLCQTLHTQVRRREMWRLIRIFTAGLHNAFSKIKSKRKVITNTPKIGNWLVLLIRMGESIRTKWVKDLLTGRAATTPTNNKTTASALREAMVQTNLQVCFSPGK